MRRQKPLKLLETLALKSVLYLYWRQVEMAPSKNRNKELLSSSMTRVLLKWKEIVHSTRRLWPRNVLLFGVTAL